MNLNVLDEFGRAFTPKLFRPNIRKFYLKAGHTEVPYRLYGAMFFLSLIITYLIYFFGIYPLIFYTSSTFTFLVLTFVYWVIVQLIVIGAMILFLYEYIDVKIFNRTKRIEAILPEFLRYVSENLKGGMSFDKALWSSIRQQFGVLADEMRLVAKRVMSGDDVENALLEFSTKYDSMMVTRSINLIVEGMRGGGELSRIIDRIEENLRQTRELKQDMNATNINYFIFLSFLCIVIAPLLFALSYNLLLVLSQLTSRVGSAVARGVVLPLNLGQVTVKPEGYADFSLAALAIISIFVSLIMSIIRKGHIKAGLRYVPIFTSASILAYFGIRFLLTLMFKAMFLG
ncbi:MAG: type II secretion system F family protein [Nanoarchaeota archaeon]|nr:type II secretion system F family protein [Nanoarchaeota archaeon]